MANAEAVLYRRIVGILLHVVIDRGDLCLFVRLCARRLRGPTDISMKRLKRGVRYANATRNFELVFPCGNGILQTRLVMQSDSDWAGNAETRKSSSCGVIALAGCVLAVIARGQNCIAHSSCEA